MKKLLLACLLALLASVAPAQAQEPGRMLLEAGIVGGNSIACPGHYVGLEGLIGYRVSAYGMVESYRCTEVPETSSRVGLSLMLARDEWSVRRALRSGLEYSDAGDVSSTAGASLTFGQRYGARFIVDRWTIPSGEAVVLLQIGAYFTL